MSTHLLGLDIGSSSIKAALVDADSGRVIAAAQSPATEMKILASRVAWAEQDPEQWWQHVCHAAAELRTKQPAAWQNVAAIGISYQMHGLVLTDSDQRPVRPSIIWCDSRAVEIGDQAFADLGRDYCLSHLLNSPGNFTASKLAWVKRNEPDVLSRAQYMMLPGDYIALKLTGEASTTAAGLSEGMLWDFKSNQTAQAVLEHYELNSDLIPPLVPIVGEQGVLCSAAAKELELSDGVMVSYRAGDQPNNAMSLACLKPGEVAATAGTSGVVYAVSDQLVADAESRVNTFMHVNGDTASRTGVLLCINGAGALYRWVRELLDETSYDALNALARDIDPGACGLLFSPYGNGAERSLSNASPGAGLSGLQVNTHGKGHFVRSALEGICFCLLYTSPSPRDPL